jgi:hypothetical protein
VTFDSTIPRVRIRIDGSLDSVQNRAEKSGRSFPCQSERMRHNHHAPGYHILQASSDVRTVSVVVVVSTKW